MQVGYDMQWTLQIVLSSEVDLIQYVYEGTEVKGIVILVHGFTWHSVYFSEIAEVLNKKGRCVPNAPPDPNNSNFRIPAGTSCTLCTSAFKRLQSACFRQTDEIGPIRSETMFRILD